MGYYSLVFSSLSNEVILGLLFAFGSCVLFGVADFVVGEFGKKITPALILSVLYLIEIPVLFALLMVTRDFGSLGPNLVLLLFGTFSTAGYFVFIYGLTHGKTTIVAPLTALIALILPAVYSVFVGDSIGTLVLIGMFISAIAIVLITKDVEPELESEKFDQKKIVKYSIFTGTISGVGFGFGLTGLGAIDTPLIMKVFLIGLPGFVAGLFWVIRNKPSIKPLKKYFATFIVINCAYIFGQLFFPLATNRTSLVITNIIVNLSTGITVFLAWIIGKEKTSKYQKLGFILAIMAIITVTLGL